MIFNPWIWLGGLVFLLVMCAGSYFKGYSDAENKLRAAHATALEQTIKQANENAQIDAQALIDHERSRREVRTVFVDKVKTVERLIYENPSDCRISDERFGLLNAAIDAANKSAASKHE